MEKFFKPIPRTIRQKFRLTGEFVHGEAYTVRAFGESGKVFAGFWRSASTSSFQHSAQSGDTLNYVIERFATLTIPATDTRFHIQPGSIIITPKGVQVYWKIEGPLFKTFLFIWDGSQPATRPLTEVQVQEITTEFQGYRYCEPAHGPLVAGELRYLQHSGSHGTIMSGIWRGEKVIAGSNVEADGMISASYTTVLVDETIFLLEGEV
ncbi:uncharacterized protein KD926_004712 [Aspergillus affinis]|uniref:uncharacterized protein n=1 Tax=Aspergillus affinis TaxID=1070780 RepID=UPI0022FE8872|nr:uncharacterized protein KD926_004712 [Aspergillus affinis]KAI9042922.1 hypothetical protein KD926_004712 [Aspergillus affinis]